MISKNFNQKLLALTLGLVLTAGSLSPVFAFEVNPGAETSVPAGFTPQVATPASNGQVLIDFETFPDTTPIPGGTSITTQFAPAGVSLFRTIAPSGPTIQQFGLTGQSGVNTLGGLGDPIFPFFSPIGVDFANPVSSVSILGLDIGSQGLHMEAYNAANVLVDSDVVINGAQCNPGIGNVDTLSVSGSGIVRVEIFQDNQIGVCDGYQIDDLMFEISLVGGESLPIDSTALLIAGASANAIWILPVLAGLAGAGIYLTRSKLNWI